ncbi:MAG: class I SAM-dependent methyltransferase [Acidobacteriota bacterium]
MSEDRESQRIRDAYARRDAVVDDRYAPWQPAQRLMLDERNRVAATLLHRRGVFPTRGRPVLEIGAGRRGWLGVLLDWGLDCTDLHAVELDAGRADDLARGLPCAEVHHGDARNLPWPEKRFQLVILSTVLTSVLDEQTRRQLLDAASRVLAPDGVLMIYDFRRDNPRNPDVRRLTAVELRAYTPELDGPIRTLTLAPPLARLLAGKSHTLASMLALVPPLRTHLLAVLGRRRA